VRVPQKACWDMLRQTCVFASRGIYGSRHVRLGFKTSTHYFSCLGGTGTDSTKLVFLHSVGSAGYAVHFNGFGARNVGSLFFMLTWAWCSLHKKRVRTRYAKLVFLHLMGSVDHIVHFGASGA
jgi:hypothetical protein